MTYDITYKCGHKGEVNINGPRAERERRVWYLENRCLCDECEEADRARRLKEAREYAAENDLPALRGTEKQIAWAEQLRMASMMTVEGDIEKYRAYLDAELKKDNGGDSRSLEHYKTYIDRYSKLLAFLSGVDSASWWIDLRIVDTGAMYRELYKQIERAEAERTAEIAPAAQDVIKEATLRPENMTKGIAKIEITGDMILAKYEKDDDFRAVLKALRFKWSPDYRAWTRRITEVCGDIKDRAAELVNALLQKGFAVMCVDEVVREKAIAADYEAECDNWISYESPSELRIYFPRDDKLNSLVRKMGASWNRDKGIYIIGISHTDNDLQELCRLYGFKYTKKAQAAIEAYHAQIEEALQTKVAVKAVAPKISDPVKDILNSSREVLPDLVDD